MIDTDLLLKTLRVDGLLVSNFFNILYTTGFQSLSPTEREAYVLLTKKGIYLITDGRYISPSSKHLFYEQLLVDPKHPAFFHIESVCKKDAVTTLGVESDSLTWREVVSLQKLSLSLSPLVRPFDVIRQTKREDELEAIQEACLIGDRALKELIPHIQVGKTEQEIAWTLEKIIREKYRAEIAFDPMVAIDANAAIPHYDTKKGKGIVKNDSLTLIDFGVKWKNYNSDMTRMIVGKSPATEIQNAYHSLQKVQMDTKKKIQKEKNWGEVDTFCRNSLIKKGYPSFPHSTGHGVGLEVHESPRINMRFTDRKQAGQVCTIEPGIYLSGKWGMRLEDTTYITSAGEAVELTQFPRDLIPV